jgi:hypothetical protein
MRIVTNGQRKVETRDPKTGEIIRYNADDDTVTLGELLRQEKFSAGMADQKNLDMQFAQSIMTDGGFVVSTSKYCTAVSYSNAVVITE